MVSSKKSTIVSVDLTAYAWLHGTFQTDMVAKKIPWPAGLLFSAVAPDACLCRENREEDGQNFYRSKRIPGVIKNFGKLDI